MREHGTINSNWMLQLADALACFWNPAVGADHEGQGAGTAMAKGLAAVEQHLRELGAEHQSIDPDQVALNVARQFTPENEPQRRARLQVAIINAIAIANADHIPSEYELVHEGELRSLRERAAVKLQTERGELWYWQGDGSDYPESLSCPVVMSADSLRELLQRHPVPAKQGDGDIARAIASLEQSMTFAQDFRPDDVRIVLDALAARHPAEHSPVVWVSPEQVAAHSDPVKGDGGHYLPVRKTQAGKFTQPLYAEAGAPKEPTLLKTFADIVNYVGDRLPVGTGLRVRGIGINDIEMAVFPQVRRIRIPARNSLDPITVFVEEYEPGQGRMVVVCYAHAWNAFWGSMGECSVLEFVAGCNPSYVSGVMLNGTAMAHNTREEEYALRVAAEVIAEAKSIIAGGVSNG